MISIAFWISLGWAAAISGSDWGSFRGPQGSGIVEVENLVDSFAPENVGWKIEIGPGYSSPVMSETHVFVTAFEGLEPATFAFDRKTGQRAWKTTAPRKLESPYRGMNTPVSSTPATDGERVYCYYLDFGLVCHEASTGKVLWTHEIDSLRIPHGMSSSPVIADDTLLLQCDQDAGSYLLAMNKVDGKVIWTVERPGVTHGYSTPVVYRPEKGPAEVILSGAYQLVGYSLSEGKKLWWMDGMCWMPMAMPTVSGDTLFVSSAMSSPAEFGAPSFDGTFEEALAEKDSNEDGKIAKSEWQDRGLAQLWFIYDLDGDGLLGKEDWQYAQARKRALGGTFAVQLGGRGNVSETHLKWKYDDTRGQSGAPSPLVYKGSVYLIKDGGVLTTLDAETGEVVKQARVGQPATYSASPIGAQGKVILASGAGQIIVLEAGNEWKELGSWELDGDLWATPAPGNGQTIIRTKNWLYAFNATTGG